MKKNPGLNGPENNPTTGILETKLLKFPWKAAGGVQSLSGLGKKRGPRAA